VFSVMPLKVGENYKSNDIQIQITSPDLISPLLTGSDVS
jgi:hypothetical protein